MPLFSLVSPEKRKKLLYGFVALVFVVLIALGAFARNGWLPSTDAMSGKKTGWFGSSGSTLQRASSQMPPEGGTLNAPLPSPTPQLSKEFLYAGNRLLIAATPQSFLTVLHAMTRTLPKRLLCEADAQSPEAGLRGGFAVFSSQLGRC